MIGRTLSQYRILDELGRGGMGVVYRALDGRLGREVALKVLNQGSGNDAEQRHRLFREARAAAALVHPNVCVVHDIGEADGVAYIAMELVRGDRLSDLIARRVPVERAIEIATDVAEGLAEAHGQGIVHRDLKPSNVLVSASGRAKIIDFGLAKVTKAMPLFDSGGDTPVREDRDEGAVLGTAPYMSPEQARGEVADERSDIFSLGALLYELVCGRSAFRRENAVETLHAVLKEPPPVLPDSALGPVAEDLQRIVDKCLRKAPAERYQTARDLAVDLREARRKVAGPGQAPQAATLRVVIVDDEPLARALLREHLAGEPDVTVVGECANGYEAVKAIGDWRPDVVFLDIQMPKLNGFEVLELLGEDARDLSVVFVTAFDQHALRAFEVSAVDYLLKPVAQERLAKALTRARERRARQIAPPPLGEVVAAARAPGVPIERILVRQGAKVHVIPTEAVDYVLAQDDYVSVRSAGREYLKQQTLGDLEKSLDPGRFVRIHRSYILNVERLVRIESGMGDSRTAILQDGTRLPVSRSGYSRLRLLL